MLSDEQVAFRILGPSNRVIHISALLDGGRKWKRNVATGGRIGPWLGAEYTILNRAAWHRLEPCLYLVVSEEDGGIRYVGISRKRLKDRWRESPAHDADTLAPLPQRQLFHSQCWKRIEGEGIRAGAGFYVHVIHATALLTLLESLDHPVRAFAELRDDGESVVASIERWLCNHRSDRVALWNVAMTGT
ncbi:hypothetical protein D9M68_337820 [compost metagenome]